jgi:hypothetical protein
MSTFTYVHNVKPERVKVVAEDGEIKITITNDDYEQTFVSLKGHDIAGIARALGNVVIKPKRELAAV